MKILWTTTTLLGYAIRTTSAYWEYIINIKHPCMRNKENIIKEVLKNPDEIHKSAVDRNVYLYYRKIERLYCVVVKHSSHKEGFIITAYPADKIKEGERVWIK